MIDSVVYELLLILILMLINGFFAGAEVALITVRRSQVNELAARGDKAGMLLKKLKETPDRFLATIQVGVTVVGTLAAVFSGATIVSALTPSIAKIPITPIQNWAGQIAIAIVVAGIATTALIIGELVPKYLALARPGPFALAVARPISWFARIGYPVVVTLTTISRGITRMLGVGASDENHIVSDREIRHLVLEGRTHGSIDKAEHELIYQALDFSDTVARQVMTPRPDITAIDLKDNLQTILRTIREEGYSRYPAFKDTVDQIDGVIYTKDIIHLLIESGPIILHDLIRPAMFVPDSMPIPQVLARFQDEHLHLAIVLDEFGGTAGLLTLEDILEEIVGEIQDEYDTETAEFRMLDDGTALVSGSFPVVDFNEEFDAQLPTDRADTLAGLISAILDRLPKLGDHVEVDGVRLEVASREKRRTRLLRARKIPNSSKQIDTAPSASQ